MKSIFATLSTFLAISAASHFQCVDIRPASECAGGAARGFCNTSSIGYAYMTLNCPATCGINCAQCVDEYPIFTCAAYAAAGWCAPSSSLFVIMETYCRATCGITCGQPQYSHYTCSSCMAARASNWWCAAGALCATAPVSALLPGDRILCPHDAWTNSSGCVASPVTDLYYEANAWAYTLINLQPAWAAGYTCLLYTSPSPRDRTRSRMPSSA